MAEPKTTHATPIAEISHGPSAFESFLDRNQKLMIILAALIAIGTGAWVVISGVEDGKRLAAGEALVAADDLVAMQDLLKNHSGTPAAISGAVILSDLQWDEGQQSASIETLRAEISAKPDHPATNPARARLAARLLQQGETQAAKSAFEELIDRPEAAYLAPYALLSLSEIARSEGDLAKSKKLLEQASERHPDHPLRNLITQAIDFVDFQMPVEIDPPAPEPVQDPGFDPPEPDLTTPIELDPTQPGTSSGNPLFDDLGDTGTTPTEPSDTAPDTPDAALPETETPPQSEPSDAAEAPPESSGEESPPTSGE